MTHAKLPIFKKRIIIKLIHSPGRLSQTYFPFRKETQKRDIFSTLDSEEI